MATITLTETVRPMDTVHVTLQDRSYLSPRPSKSSKPNAMKLPPVLVIQPGRKKITMLEAQRVMAVITETIKRTELVSAIPYIIEHMERFRVVLGSELTELLEEHERIMAAYNDYAERLERAQDALNPRDAKKTSHSVDAPVIRIEDEFGKVETSTSASSSQICHRDESVAAISTHATPLPELPAVEPAQLQSLLFSVRVLTQQIRDSTKFIIRAFNANPIAISAVLKDCPHSPGAKHFIEGLLSLSTLLKGMLLTSPAEEAQRKRGTQCLQDREKFVTEAIGKAEVALGTAVEERDKEVNVRNAEIQKLYDTIDHLERYSDEQVRIMKLDAEKQGSLEKRQSEARRKKLAETCADLLSKLRALRSEHWASEMLLRRKKFRLESEIENWIKKYDTEMGEKQDEYEQIDAEYTEEKKQLAELEERYAALDIQYQALMAEREAARLKRESEARTAQHRLRAAITIQAYWRSYKVRKIIRKLKKKRKAKRKQKRGTGSKSRSRSRSPGKISGASRSRTLSSKSVGKSAA